MKPRDTVPLPTCKIKYPSKIDSEKVLYVSWWEYRGENVPWAFESVVFTDKIEGIQFYQELNRLSLP
jgi:hypothetical protein